MERADSPSTSHPLDDQRDRGRGCLLGLALGDALGAPFEFLQARDIPCPIPPFEQPWMGFPPGTTTDDTAMARNLVRSLIERGGFDPEDLVSRHVTWFDCAPLGVAYANRPDELLELAPRLSSLTHFDQRCRTAVIAVTLAVASLVRGDRPRSALASALDAVAHRDGGEELEYLVEAAGTVHPVDGPDQGFCLFAAAIGLQALGAERRFEDRLLAVARWAEIRSRTGRWRGHWQEQRWASPGFPRPGLDRLVDRAELEAEAEGLAGLAWMLGSPRRDL